MRKQTKYHLVGLWQIWDALPDAPDARERPPEALDECYIQGFDAEPEVRDVRRAMATAEDALRQKTEAQERLGYVIVDDRRWQAMQAEIGWTGGRRRHTAVAETLRYLVPYELDMTQVLDAESDLWRAPARDYGPPFEAVMESLDQMGREQGLGPETLGPEVPYFDSARTAPPQRRQRRQNRDRGQTL